MNWELLRSDEMKAAVEKSGGLCILPLGCVEKHGPHLPLGTDSMKVKQCVEDAAKLEDVVIFPTGLWLGDMVPVHYVEDPLEDSSGAGNIVLSPHTLLTVMEELCDEIARNGFRKILIVTSHGGNNAFLDFFLRTQAYKKKNYATMVTGHRVRQLNKDPYPYFLEHRAEYPMLTDEDMETLRKYHDEGGFGGGHADFSETANIMGYWPELVAEDRYEVESGYTTHRGDYLKAEGVKCSLDWVANYPNAYAAYPPHGCTKTIGEAWNLCYTRRLARIFKMLKEDEECVNIAQGK